LKWERLPELPEKPGWEIVKTADMNSTTVMRISVKYVVPGYEAAYSNTDLRPDHFVFTGKNVSDSGLCTPCFDLYGLY
jgi:hypothetical protein